MKTGFSVQGSAFSISSFISLLALSVSASDWTPLFDGTSTRGWIGDTNGYVIENGAMVCKPGGNILTEKEYSDFELEFEFQLTPGANNGLGIRTPASGNAAYQGMELQILDSEHPKYKDLHDYQWHGSIYGVVPAQHGHMKPTGEWNHERVVAIGDHIKVELNGATIVDAHLDDVQPVDGQPHPGLHNKSGHIGWLGHGDRVAFRSIRIRDFALPPPVPGTADNTPPAGFTALFNGQDLTGWKGLVADPPKRAKMTPEQLAAAQAKADERMRGHWRVENGQLVFDGKGDNLCTGKDYGDFDFYVDWKIPATADSGIYLRGSPQIQIWDPENKAQWAHGSDKGSGALWNNQKAGNRPLVKADKPTGEWNTFHIRMVGAKVSVWLNGQQVLDRVVMENYWERALPIYPEGAIELQNHGNTLFFKNLYVRELPR